MKRSTIIATFCFAVSLAALPAAPHAAGVGPNASRPSSKAPQRLEHRGTRAAARAALAVSGTLLLATSIKGVIAGDSHFTFSTGAAGANLLKTAFAPKKGFAKRVSEGLLSSAGAGLAGLGLDASMLAIFDTQQIVHSAGPLQQAASTVVEATGVLGVFGSSAGVVATTAANPNGPLKR